VPEEGSDEICLWFALEFKFGHAKIVQNLLVYRWLKRLTQSTKAKISVWEIVKRKVKTIEAKYEYAVEIAAKIVGAQLNGWHILIGLSQFADRRLVLKNHVFVDYLHAF
jgi:hypothetical protein